MTTRQELTQRREAQINTSSDLKQEAVKEITGALNLLLADVFTLYLKTKNFHWHMSGPHFRDIICSSTNRQSRSSAQQTKSRSVSERSAG